MKLQKEIDKIKAQWGLFFETVDRPLKCIFCKGTRIHWNGQRERTASVMRGDKVVYLADIPCKRVKCAEPNCRRSWTLRPPGLMPRRHYQLCVVAHGAKMFLFESRETLTSVADKHQCSRRTIGRWLNWIAGIAEYSDLIHRLQSISKEAVFSAESRISTVITKVLDVGKRVFQPTVKNLCILEALGKAYDYEPPGFVGMIESVIANRDRIATYRFPFIPELAR